MWLTFGEKQFLLLFVPFYWLDQKCGLKNPNFPQDFPFSNIVRKTNFLSISLLVSVKVTFMSKKKNCL